ncbi:MAG: hypothetical protein ABIL16_07745 [candidate division WOR-3 bacterium]
MKILPLEEPIISPIFGKKCVYYRTKILALYQNSAKVIYEEERSIDYLIFERVKEKKYVKFYPAWISTKDPFSLFTAEDILKLIRTDLIGFLAEEEVLEV